MNKQQLKRQIEELANEMSCTFVEAASAMQTASVQMGKRSLKKPLDYWGNRNKYN